MQSTFKRHMNKSLLAALAVSSLLLAGCGSSAPEGKYKVTKTAMGFNIGSSKAEIDNDFIIIDGNKYEVDEWVTDDDGKIIARNKEGQALLSATVSGDDLLVEEGGGSIQMKFTRI